MDAPRAAAPQGAGHVDSYYAATAARLPSFPVFEGSRETEVCVVGGGLAGLTTAHELAKAGRDVVLLEAARVGWGASGRNGGFVSAGFAESIFAVEAKLGLDHAKSLWRLSAEGVGHVRRTILDAGRIPIIGGNGWLKLIRHGDIAGLERRAQRMARDYDVAWRVLGGDELSHYVRSPRYFAGLLDMAPFHIQPLEYCGLVAELAAAAGAAIFEGSRVAKVSRQPGGWRIETQGGTIEARDLVLATSAHGGPSRRLDDAVLPVSTYVVAARSEKLFEAIRFRGCIGDTRRASDYYRLVGSGEQQRLLWGGRITTRVSEPRGLGEALLRDIAGVFPQLDDLKVEHAWTGAMGYAVHKMPIVGRIGEGLWAVTAFGGHGINTTAIAGRLVASAIAQGDDRWRLFEPYGPVRAGGALGRAATQIEHWRLQMLDRFEEWQARPRRR